MPVLRLPVKRALRDASKRAFCGAAGLSTEASGEGGGEPRACPPNPPAKAGGADLGGCHGRSARSEAPRRDSGDFSAFTHSPWFPSGVWHSHASSIPVTFSAMVCSSRRAGAFRVSSLISCPPFSSVWAVGREVEMRFYYATPSGYELCYAMFPKVGKKRQPWALIFNPVGTNGMDAE
jgi:hypothetical protein